jgi:hypothetical protein
MSSLRNFSFRSSAVYHIFRADQVIALWPQYLLRRHLYCLITDDQSLPNKYYISDVEEQPLSNFLRWICGSIVNILAKSKLRCLIPEHSNVDVKEH